MGPAKSILASLHPRSHFLRFAPYHYASPDTKRTAQREREQKQKQTKMRAHAVPHTALKSELARSAAGPGGLLPRTPGLRIDPDTRSFDVTARGGLAVSGRAVQFPGDFAVTRLNKDTVLTPADAGVVRVVDLISPASTGVHVTLPTAAELVGNTFEFVVERDAASPVNNAVFSVSLSDNSVMTARAIASESHTFPPPCYSHTTSLRSFQARTTRVRSPGVFCFYERTGARAISSYTPIYVQMLSKLQSQGLIDDSIEWYADSSAQGASVTTRPNAATLGGSTGDRVSLASTGDTVRVWAAAPDMVVAECLFQYATAWS
jgi:hypothetical protein